MAGYFQRRLMGLAVLSAFCLWPQPAAEARMVILTTTQVSFVKVEGAGGQPEIAEKKYIGQKITRDFQKTDIRDVIRSIAGISGKNIVIHDAVRGKVTLKLKDVPWDQALELVLAARNLAVEESGNVLMVYDMSTLQKIQADRTRRP